MFTRFLVVFLFLLASTMIGCSPFSGIHVEQLRPSIPVGFKKVSDNGSPNGNYTEEYVPQNQMLENWDEIITVQYIELRDPIASQEIAAKEFYSGIQALMPSFCQDFSSDAPVVVGREINNGVKYPIVRGATFCGKNLKTNLGEVTYYSIIAGASGVHVLQRAIRTQPFAKGTFSLDEFRKREWNQFFEQSKLCYAYSRFASNPPDQCFNM